MKQVNDGSLHNIWATFVRKFVAKIFQNCPTWLHCSRPSQWKDKSCLQCDQKNRRMPIKVAQK